MLYFRLVLALLILVNFYLISMEQDGAEISLKNNILRFYAYTIKDMDMTRDKVSQNLFNDLKQLPEDLKEQFQLFYIKSFGKFINLHNDELTELHDDDWHEHFLFVIKNNLVPCDDFIVDQIVKTDFSDPAQKLDALNKISKFYVYNTQLIKNEENNQVQDWFYFLPSQLQQGIRLYYWSSNGVSIYFCPGKLLNNEKMYPSNKEWIQNLIRRKLIPSIEEPNNWAKVLEQSEKENTRWQALAFKRLTSTQSNGSVPINEMNCSAISRAYAILSVEENNYLDTNNYPRLRLSMPSWVSFLPAEYQQDAVDLNFYSVHE